MIDCSAVDPDSPYVSGTISWVTIDPGQQRIGSFHPITEGDWTEGAYVTRETEELIMAISRNDVAALKAQVAAGTVDINAKDANGRTALHIAVYNNAIDCAKFLLDKEARVDFRTSDGRTALHLAAQVGLTRPHTRRREGSESNCFVCV